LQSSLNKHLIVGGVVRSGKTIFCKKLVETFSISHIPVDKMVVSLHNVFPSYNIRHSNINYQERCENLAPFLYDFMEQNKKNGKFIYVFDSYHILPEHVFLKLDLRFFHVFFFGYPAITVNEKCKYIKDYAKKHGCWTEGCYRDDRALKQAVENSIEKSKKLKQESEKYGFTFVDTSYDFEKTINKLVDKLATKLF